MSLWVVQEGVWGARGTSQVTDWVGGAGVGQAGQESPIEGVAWAVEHSCRARSPHAPLSQVEGAQ